MSVLSIMSAISDNKPIAIAPKSGPTPHESPNESETSMPYTCLTCARRKVKCDKAAPTCSTCRKARLDCTYQEPAPRKRKRKPVEDVHERLEQYEKILKANGLLPGEEEKPYNPQTAEPEWPFLLNTVGPRAPEQSNAGKLVGGEGKARYISSTVYKNLGEDFEPSSDEEDDDADATATPAGSFLQQSRAADPLSAAILTPGASSTSLLDWHPTYETAMKLWKLYVDNVDPVVKAVHVPTMQKILQRAAAQPSGVPKATEAVLFAIYHFAIVSIEDEKCTTMFGETKKALRARYEAATRQALVTAQFLKSANMTVVQAFILYLLSMRSTLDPQTFWILTGVAVRMGQRLGLHRDGDELGLRPFDTQMRRRVFWQLLPLDGMAGQLSGTGICITLDSWSTKQPLNLNDADIWPDMEHTPEPHTGATDMIFCLARTEMAKIVRTAFSTKTSDMDPLEAMNYKVKDHHLTVLEDELESKYLRYCDFANPVHLLTLAMARAGINGGRLRVRLPRAKAAADLPDEERKEVWTIANKILDYHISANTNTHLDRFWWHLKAFFQSDALVWILNELRRDPARYKDESPWEKIEKTYANHPDLAAQKRSLHIAVGRLTLKSWDATHAYYVQQQQQDPSIMIPPEPAFITAIRYRPSRKESVANTSSNQPTPESLQLQAQYNPFNPGDTSDDLMLNYPFGVTPGSNASGFVGMGVMGMGMGTGAQGNMFGTGGMNGIGGEFDFNQMVDSTGSIDWMFWDQLVRDPTSVMPSHAFG